MGWQPHNEATEGETKMIYGQQCGCGKPSYVGFETEEEFQKFQSLIQPETHEGQWVERLESLPEGVTLKFESHSFSNMYQQFDPTL